ncbi:MAG: signal peptidase I [Halobacteriovoraceae bacterium]|nr:signal peptidase I [Halobacteriovoraceae bacterium]MBC96262.1 signal peptidase I [Halobacteriovoraceae bacterium]|tara:strand:+ start:57044 stop:57883 length:840 start_codon:yes stop_codon:yes gene_type:complete
METPNNSDLNSNENELVDESSDLNQEKINVEEQVSRRFKTKSYLKEIVIILSIFISVIIFRSVVYEPFKIPTGSMIPTLRIGDFILVNKFAYGIKVPFSDITLSTFSSDPIYLFNEKPVKRGDIIVFKYPKDPNINYIKRVIGLPGDSIEIKDKFVYLNGEKVKTIKLDGTKYMETMDEKFRDNNLSFYRAYIGDKSFVYQVDNDNYFVVNAEKKIVPEGHYFVMGDNRDFSYDSRFWGFVPHKYIKGKAVLIWMSLDVPEDGTKEIVFRSDRIGTSVD